MSHYMPYTAYKDSEVEWLGRVPEHWVVCKLSYRYSIELGKMLDEKRLTKTSLLPYLRNQDVQWGSINTQDLPEMDIHPEELERYTIRDGDLLVCEGGDVGRAAIWRGESGTLGYQKALHRLRHRSVETDTAEFFYFSLLTAKQRGVFEESDSKATIAHLPAEKFRQYRFAFPSLAEQRFIAAQLDRETARIDALIEKKTRFIELLREKRQALITHAVTKGLDPNVKMKDSGVEWLGEVPEHWIICNVQHVIAKIEQGWSPDCLNTPAEDGQWGVVKSGCVNGGTFTPEENKALPVHLSPMPEYEIKVGDVLMSRASGSPELIGSIALVKETPEKLMLSDKIFRLQCSEKMLPSFFTVIMGARVVRAQVEQSISGADGLANNLPQSRIKKFVLPCPPVKEQLEIASFTDAQICRLQGLREKTERSIELLKERRSALITAAVTGQIDLREAV